MRSPFYKTSSKPSVVSPGHSFLIKPKFIVNKETMLSFNWQLKCAKELPVISLKVIKITKGSGIHMIDVSEHFIFPRKMEFPETKALSSKANAVLETNLVLKIVDFKTVPVGTLRMVIAMEFWDESNLVSQNFGLIRR